MRNFKDKAPTDKTCKDCTHNRDLECWYNGKYYGQLMGYNGCDNFKSIATMLNEDIETLGQAIMNGELDELIIKDKPWV